jgi:hypothetical protein
MTPEQQAEIYLDMFDPDEYYNIHKEALMILDDVLDNLDEDNVEDIEFYWAVRDIITNKSERENKILG